MGGRAETGSRAEREPAKDYNADPQKLQHVVEEAGPTLAEQREHPPVPTRNGLRMRRRGDDDCRAYPRGLKPSHPIPGRFQT